MGLPCWTISAASSQYFFFIIIIFNSELPNKLYFSVMFGFAFPLSIPLLHGCFAASFLFFFFFLFPVKFWEDAKCQSYL